MDNTALSGYWARQYDDAKASPLCSQCNPDIKKWHGRFERQQKPEGHVVGPDGFVYEKNDSYLRRLRKEAKKKT